MVDQKPTAAAMRAAELIVRHANYIVTMGVSAETVAAIIDAETRLPELIAALTDMDCVLIQEIQYGRFGSQCAESDQCVCDKHRLNRISAVRTKARTALARASEAPRG